MLYCTSRAQSKASDTTSFHLTSSLCGCGPKSFLTSSKSTWTTFFKIRERISFFFLRYCFSAFKKYMFVYNTSVQWKKHLLPEWMLSELQRTSKAIYNKCIVHKDPEYLTKACICPLLLCMSAPWFHSITFMANHLKINVLWTDFKQPLLETMVIFIEKLHFHKVRVLHSTFFKGTEKFKLQGTK